MTNQAKCWVSVIAGLLAACSSAQDAMSNRQGVAPMHGGSAPVGPVATPTMAAGAGAFDNGQGVVTMGAPVSTVDPNAACNQDVDVVFSLDVSGSMTPSLTKLADEVGMVDAALKKKNLPSPPHYGLVIFVDDFMVMNNGQPYADVNALIAEVQNQAMITSMDSAREVGPDDNNLTWPENSLDPLYAAATQFAWRPVKTTLRTIFHITDASFWVGTDPSSGAQSEAPIPGLNHMSTHGYAETIQALRMQQIWVNIFAAKTGGPPDGMPAPASHGQFRGTSVDVGIGFFEPYMGMKSIPDSTGGQAWDLDDVYDGKISLGTPIEQSIEARQCVQYPM